MDISGKLSQTLIIKVMKTYFELSVHQKINLKQHAINVYGHSWHTKKPDFLKRLNILQIHTILN